VEGVDDKHVVWHLLQHHGFPEIIDVLDKGGVENVLKVLPVHLKGSGIDAIGVMLDADIEINSRWIQLKSILEKAGYLAVPDRPIQGGAVISHEVLPKIGVWLMPDNTLPGMLEDFVACLVPPGDRVLPFAKSAVAEPARIPAPFNINHKTKAEIHTWLAWQDDPGTPLGLAITKRYLDPDAESAITFLDWLHRLFDP
jgi:hypothetical protein